MTAPYPLNEPNGVPRAGTTANTPGSAGTPAPSTGNLYFNDSTGQPLIHNGTAYLPTSVFPPATVACAGASQTAAAALTLFGSNIVTGANNSAGVGVTGTPALGIPTFIKNTDATHTAAVYAPVGYSINNLTANSAYSLAANTGIQLIFDSATTAHTFP